MRRIKNFLAWWVEGPAEYEFIIGNPEIGEWQVTITCDRPRLVWVGVALIVLLIALFI